MPRTDTSEEGLESLIFAAMTGYRQAPARGDGEIAEQASQYSGGTGWHPGLAEEYSRDYTVDLEHLTTFLEATQPDALERLDLTEDSPTRRKFLARLQGEISKRGVIDVLRHGIRHGPLELHLFYGTPTPGNVEAEELNRLNRFSVTRQLRYSRDETRRALDLALFINGLPVATFELKNSLTKQTMPATRSGRSTVTFQ